MDLVAVLQLDSGALLLCDGLSADSAERFPAVHFPMGVSLFPH
jgi:hypothetical protein